MPSVACPALSFFFFFLHFLINGTILGEKLLIIKCVFWFSLQFLTETCFILRRILQDIIINVHWQSRKEPIILSRLNATWIFSTDCRKTQTQNLMKIRQVGAELFHAEGWTGRHDEANSRFSQICERA